MSETNEWWLGRAGAPAGPYAEAQILAWLADGTTTPDDLAWREGMPEWRSLRDLFPEAAASAPPFSAPPTAQTVDLAIPPPTGPHWLWLVLITVVTFGIGMWIWSFVQASWVKRIDPRNRSGGWLLAAIGCIAVDFFLRLPMTMANAPSGTTHVLGLLTIAIKLSQLVFFYIAVFSMSESMRRVLPKHGLRPEIGGIILFFFSTLYLQAQMNWVDRALQGGSRESDVSKLAVWAVGVPVSLACFLVLVALRGMHV
jgi:uncharacterized membrane protein YidH (DUF202 family)